MGIPISEEAKDGQGVELGTVSRDSARAGTRVLAGVSGRSWQEAVAGPGRQQVAPGWAVSHQGTDCFLIWALLFFTTGQGDTITLHFCLPAAPQGPRAKAGAGLRENCRVATPAEVTTPPCPFQTNHSSWLALCRHQDGK